MDDKQLYQKKMQSQLDEWSAELDKLKAKASGANADVQLQINKQVEGLQPYVDQAKALPLNHTRQVTFPMVYLRY
jgi:hypothetical protein